MRAHAIRLACLAGLGRCALAAVAILAGASTTDMVCAADAVPAVPTLDLEFDAVPHWRQGAMPGSATARPFTDKDFILNAGLVSGFAAHLSTPGGRQAVWSSLSHEEEAYPNGAAIAALHVDPFSIRGKALVLTASVMPLAATATLPPNLTRCFLSGAFNTYPFSRTYGYFEITARVPKGVGLWPAFWLLPVDQSWPPEIDVAEILAGDVRKAYFSIHTKDQDWVRTQPGSYNQSTTTETAAVAADLSDDFHRYAVSWTRTDITFFLDDRMVGRRRTPADMHQPFYLIVNLAVGGKGSWAGPPSAATLFPASLEIRSIKIWTRNPHAQH